MHLDVIIASGLGDLLLNCLVIISSSEWCYFQLSANWCVLIMFIYILCCSLIATALFILVQLKSPSITCISSFYVSCFCYVFMSSSIVPWFRYTFYICIVVSLSFLILMCIVFLFVIVCMISSCIFLLIIVSTPLELFDEYGYRSADHSCSCCTWDLGLFKSKAQRQKFNSCKMERHL